MARAKTQWEEEVSRLKVMIENWQQKLVDIERKIKNPKEIPTQEFGTLISERSHIIKMIHDMETRVKERYNGEIKQTKKELFIGETLSY